MVDQLHAEVVGSMSEGTYVPNSCIQSFIQCAFVKACFESGNGLRNIKMGLAGVAQ